MRHSFSQIHMGCRVTIVCYGDSSLVHSACSAAFSRFAELDQIMSDYRPSSELMRLCRSSGPVQVSLDLFTVLEHSLRVSVLTDGAFDVTCGALVRVWRAARECGCLPSRDALDLALGSCGFEGLVLDRASMTVELRKPGMMLDLGAVGKGYACDEALKVLGGYGVESALVEAGGDVAVSGAPPGREGWTVEIRGETPPIPMGETPLLHMGETPLIHMGETPLIPMGETPLIHMGETPLIPMGETPMLRYCGIATSGDSFQHLELDGSRYSHVIDPRTGEALVNQPQVTVKAPSAMVADSLTKAALCENRDEILRVFGAEILA